MSNKKEHYKWLDIAKGFTILFVILGHIDTSFSAGAQIFHRFFTLFHVSIFFILSGLTINGEKIKSMKAFIPGKIKNIYLKALLFYLPAVWLHNLFCSIGFYDAVLYPNNAKYAPYEGMTMMKQTLLTLLCAGREPILSAMWFVFVLFFALIGYCILSSILAKIIKEKKHYEGTRTVLIWIGLVISAYLTHHFDFTINRFSNVFPAIALIHIGFLLKEYVKIKFDNIYVFLISAIGLLQSMEYGRVSLNDNIFGNPVFLISTGVFAFYVICYTAKKIEAFSWSNAIALCGKYSFYIMALHMVVFKLLTFVLSRCYDTTMKLGQLMPEVSNYGELLLYVAVPALLSVCFGYLIENYIFGHKKRG